MIQVGDRLEVSINGAIRKAVVLSRYVPSSSSGTPGFVLGLDQPYRNGLYASWSPVKKNRHSLVLVCFQYSIDPDEPLCFIWVDNDNSILLIQKILGAVVDTVPMMKATIPIAVQQTEKSCPNPTCQKKNDLTASHCWWCSGPV